MTSKTSVSKTKTKKEASGASTETSSVSLKWRVLNMTGKEVGSLDLNPEVFGVEPNRALVHDTVRWQLAKRRSGTHQALTRSMMRGGGKKPFKQKHTGRARAGSIISPLWVGGASVHGPLPKSYEFFLAKRSRRQALASVLSDKVLGNTLLIVDELTLSDKKTKSMKAVLNAIGVNDNSAVIVTHTKDEGVSLTSRNLANVISLDAGAANVYDLLKHKYIVCTKEGVKSLETRVLKG